MHFHIHPIMVHFPIALFISALGLEVLSIIFKKEKLHQTAWINYILGVVAAIAAILSALLENQTIKHPVFYTHRVLGYWTLIVSFTAFLVLFLIRRKSIRLFRISFVVLLIITAVLVTITGYYGGRLVYEYGVGVE